MVVADQAVIKAWQDAAAASDMEIAPVIIETDESTLHAGALIVGFGSSKGTLIHSAPTSMTMTIACGANASGPATTSQR